MTTSPPPMNIDATQKMLIHVASNMVASKEMLTQADLTIGDGDHGIGMARGFEAVQKKLETTTFDNISDLFKNVGMALMSNVGGASGAIFGTLFRGGAQKVPETDSFSTPILATVLSEGLAAVQSRGGAKEGDKTMIDALAPAAAKAIECGDQPLSESLPAIVETAKAGSEKTKEMIATTGKSKTLGDRSIGYPDPGSISMYLILQFMLEFISETNG